MTINPDHMQTARTVPGLPFYTIDPARRFEQKSAPVFESENALEIV